MSTGYAMGIDPGIEGGWAVVDDDDSLVAAGALPTVGEGRSRVLSAPLFTSLVTLYPPKSVALERVGAMPGNGAVSMFRFGQSVGVIEGVLGALGTPIIRVAPTVWKRSFGLPREKEAARQKAIETWPALATLHFSRKKDHGVAEAALIALWLQRANRLAGAA